METKQTRSARVTREKTMEFESAFSPFSAEETKEALSLAMKSGMTVHDAISAVREYGEEHLLSDEFISLREAVLSRVLSNAVSDLKDLLGVLPFTDDEVEVNAEYEYGDGKYFNVGADVEYSLRQSIKRSGVAIKDLSKATQFFIKQIKQISK